MDGVNHGQDYRAQLERLKAFIRACLRLSVDADDAAINAAIAARGGFPRCRYETREMLIRGRTH